MESKVAIVGGGITGLSLAYYLQQSGAPYLLLEQSDRWGGKILTEEVDDFVIEAGPDAFLTRKPWALQLAHELGLADRLLPTNQLPHTIFVLNHGRPTPMPDGLSLLAPTKLGPFLRSPLISPWGKLRMGLDLLIPARRDTADETLGDFVRRRLGQEALDKLAEPLLAGIYSNDPERQSMLATFPQFRQLEAKHGSLIRGLLAGQRQSAASAAPALPPLVSFQAGMKELVTALVDGLKGDLRLATGVTALHGRSGHYELSLSHGERVTATAVVLTLPSHHAAHLLADAAPEAAVLLNAIRYTSLGTISLAYRRADLPETPAGFGVVIPRTERRPINGITWSSVKFDQRAPDGYELLRLFFGGPRNPQMMELDDDELLNVARRELAAIMGIEAPPLFHRIHRWSDAYPQYDVGHLERVSAIEAALPPGVYVTGSPYRGIGIPDCVYQAQQTAVRIVGDKGIYG